MDGASATAPASPSRTGYTFAGWDVSFTNVTGDLTVTATYTINSYTLTINYKYANGTTAAAAYTHSYNYGAAYSVTSPTITGYTPNASQVTGVMPANNVNVIVVYNANSYTLTIYYEFADGTQAAATYTASVAFGASYSVTSPTIEGYTPDPAVVTGVMGASNAVYTVTYTANSTPGNLPGDADCSGEVTFADVSCIYLYMIGFEELSPQGELNADYDGDGIVSFGDISALYIDLIS